MVVPNQYLLTDRAAENLRQYVQAGGTLVVGFFSGIVDEHDHIRLGGYPAPWQDLLGLKVEEFDPFPLGVSTTTVLPDGTSYPADLWGEVIHLQGAEALATFGDRWYAGAPAVTRHTFGLGAAYYVGTRLDPAGMDWVLGLARNNAGLSPELDVPQGVEVVTRSGEHDYLFVLNHTEENVTVVLPAGTDLLSGEQTGGPMPLASRAVVVVQKA